MLKKLPSKSVLLAILILVIVIVLGLLQLIKYLTPPSKGEPCKAAIPQTESSTQLIPEGSITVDSPQVEPLAALPASQAYARSGFGLSSAADASLWSARLGTSWYLDWDVQPIRSKQVPTHWQTIRLRPGCIYPSLEYIRWVAKRFPGNVWVIGNEPDVIWQDSITAEEYAQDYHLLYTLIKEADPKAKIAVGGIAGATPLRLQYLDRVLEYYQDNFGEPLPADWWTLHGYVLQEKRGSWGVEIPPGFSVDSGELYTISDHGDFALFQKQIINFRSWMTENGYRETPLALTEFGILMPDTFGYTQYWISIYLKMSVGWLDTAKDDQIGFPQDDNHLVQKWAWFSLADPLYPTSDLATFGTDSLTLIGQAYREFNSTAGK